VAVTVNDEVVAVSDVVLVADVSVAVVEVEVMEVAVPVVVVLVAEVKTDKETVLDTKDMVHSTTLLSQVAPSSGSSAVHKYLSLAEFLSDTWLLLCPVSTV